jgi:hypothetical protein
MELDELKEKWAEHDRKLDESIRLNRQLLRDMYTRRARFALWRLATMLAAGALCMLAIIVSLGRFIAQNWSMPRIAWPAIVLDVLAIATLAALNAQIGLALNINYNQPIAVIQKRLETLRKFRIRYIQAIFLMATLTWVTIFIVLTRLFNTAWVVANVVFGLLVFAIGIWVARRYGDRMSNSAFGRRFLRELAGYNLNAASDFMATLAEFEKD